MLHQNRINIMNEGITFQREVQLSTQRDYKKKSGIIEEGVIFAKLEIISFGVAVQERLQ